MGKTYKDRNKYNAKQDRKENRTTFTFPTVDTRGARNTGWKHLKSPSDVMLLDAEDEE